ncbi:MAG: MgtC/SapB family protein [Bacteroidales bacterium]|nr:MgtC/SapB family protein [Bacteroidales bacterium]
MSLTLELCLRLLAAGLAGGAIGYERELRAKGAGVRTHVLVALGSALFMVISQYGFRTASSFDAARIAAGVVTGIGFLGGGLIIKKNHISGLTTAAGLWVTGAIGLGMGGGMYVISLVCAVLVLICMEALNFYSIKLGDKEVVATLASKDESALAEVIDSFGKRMKNFSLSKQGDSFKATVELRVPKKEYNAGLLKSLSALPDVELESLE